MPIYQLIEEPVFPPAHLESPGAEPLPRKDFLRLLKGALVTATLKGSWSARFGP
jgi:hypothetical protein